MARVTVVGGGCVGLVSACFYARAGHRTTIVESDTQRRTQIERAEAPFYEPGLDSVLRDVVSTGKLVVCEDIQTTIAKTDVTFVAVGTPSGREGSIDLTQVRKASKEVARGLTRCDEYHYVVVRSTVVPGTTVNLVKPILERYSGRQVGRGFGLAMQPEFLREGNALEDMEHPDKIVIGAIDDRTTHFLARFYEHLHGGHVPPILTMNASTAEMVKYANNSFLACKISFINEIADICQRIPEVDVVQVADAIGLDKRIGRSFLDAGLGFGGSCFPKDVRALIRESRRLKYSPAMLEATLMVNNRQPLVAVEMAGSSLRILKGRRVAVLGCSFKPGTDDIREAPSILVITRLLKLGARVVLYDPKALEAARRIFGSKVEYADSVEESLADAECAIMVTEWDEFKQLTAQDFASMKRQLIVDGRRIYRPEEFADRTELRAVGLGPRMARLGSPGGKHPRGCD